MIRFTDVFMHYPGGKDVLKNINLQVEQGEMVYLTGHSGAGKTTLLRLVALAERHSRGQIIVNGQNLARALRQAYPVVPAQYRFHVPGTSVVERPHRVR